MMKTTQFLTNIKFWQSSLVALLFLFSFTVNSQSVGDDLMVASNGALTNDVVAGQGSSCLPCGWSGVSGVNYAPTTGNHGPTHSGDRMWKTFAGNGGNGEFVNQVFTDIAAGTYTLTFYHRWTNGGAVDYSAGAGPQVTFKKSDGDSGWLDGYAAEVPQGNIGADAEWTENVYTIEVAEAGTYRMQVYKNGGSSNNPTNMFGSLHLDTFSFVYTAEPAVTYNVNITSAGGSYASEKWINVTTEANGAGTQVWGQGDGTYSNGSGLINQDIQLEAGTYYVNAYDKYSDGWDGTTLTVTQGPVVLVDGVVPSDGVDADASGGWESADSGELEGSYEITIADQSSVPVLSLQGVIDIDVSGGAGKAVHLVASGDVADLSAYGIGSANNQQGTDGEEFTLSGSISAGQHILITNSAADATGADVFLEGYLGASEVFDLILNGAGSALQGNGNDAYELFFNGEVIDTFGVTGNVGDASQTSDYSMDWAYRDSWAYVVDGAWTYGGNDCTDDSETSCGSSCPYPFIADACPFVPTVIDGAACLDFEGDSATKGWRFQDITGNDSAWEIAGSPVLNGEGSLGHSYFPTDVAFVDVAVSPTFNTLAMTDARLRYSEYMNYSGDGTNNVVYYTLDDPATLNDAASANVVALDVGINADAEGVWVERVFDLPEAENVTLLFLYQGTFGHSWNIDDMCVEEVPPPPFHDVTFNLDARNIIVADDGIYMGGGIFGSAQGVAMSDDDGDGIWSAVVNLQEGTTGEFIFLNSPGDGGDYNGRTEYLADTACATGQYNDRAIPAFDADNLVFNYCFSVCNDTNTGCAEAVTRHDVKFTVGTANIEADENGVTVGPGGMYLGGGIMGHGKAFSMSDNGDDTHSVTVSVPEGQAGNYVFLNSPSNHYSYEGKEDLSGLECAAGEYNDRYLDAVTEATSVQFCYGTCDTECAAPNNGIAEFPACFDFEGDAALEGWQIVPLEGTAADPTWQILTGPAVDDVNATDNGLLVHPYGPQDVLLHNFAISPQFNTSGMSDAQLSYDEWIQDGTYGTAHRVWVSTDEVLSFTSDNLTLLLDNIHGTDFEFNSVVLDLPEADYVTVIFDYEGTWGSLWALDNMCVEETPAEPNFVTADPNNAWGGYMEVFEVNADGGTGNFVFGEPWGVADLQTTLQPDVPNMILEPNVNVYDAENPFWSNGELGNKIMIATTQVESWENYNGADLTFTGSVAENTLEGYETVYFIKCLNPDAGWSDMLGGQYVLPLPESGEFSVTVSGDLLPAGKLVQFGFSVIGLNANPASDYGKVVIGDVGLSIGENDSLDMVIYPNPVDGDYVTIQTPLNGDKLVEVFDVNGRKVMERLLTTNTLNVGSISAGMYIVKVTVEGQSNVSKLIIE